MLDAEQECARQKLRAAHAANEAEELRGRLQAEIERGSRASGSQEEFEALKAQVTQLAQIKESNDQLRTNAREATARAQGLEQRAKDLEAQITPLKQAVGKLETERTALTADNKQLKEQVQRWTKRAHELQDKYGGGGVDQAEHDKVAARAEEAERKVVELTQQAAAAAAKLKTAQDAAAAAGAKAKEAGAGAAAEGKVRELEGKVRALETSPPPSRTKWTRRVPHPVLIGHAAGGQVRELETGKKELETRLEKTKKTGLDWHKKAQEQKEEIKKLKDDAAAAATPGAGSDAELDAARKEAQAARDEAERVRGETSKAQQAAETRAAGLTQELEASKTQVNTPPPPPVLTGHVSSLLPY